MAFDIIDGDADSPLTHGPEGNILRDADGEYFIGRSGVRVRVNRQGRNTADGYVVPTSRQHFEPMVGSQMGEQPLVVVDGDLLMEGLGRQPAIKAATAHQQSAYQPQASGAATGETPYGGQGSQPPLQHQPAAAPILVKVESVQFVMGGLRVPVACHSASVQGSFLVITWDTRAVPVLPVPSIFQEGDEQSVGVMAAGMDRVMVCDYLGQEFEVGPYKVMVLLIRGVRGAAEVAKARREASQFQELPFSGPLSQ